MTTVTEELRAAGTVVRHKRESALMQVIGALFWCIGRRKWFLDQTWTTVWRTIWAPDDTDLARLEMYAPIVLHELEHVRQWKRYPVVGQLAYLFLLPAGLAWFRWVFEREAYLVNIRAGRDIESVVQTLGGIGYLWCWPKPWQRKWFQKALAPEVSQ